jgi:hypothetical protein
MDIVIGSKIGVLFSGIFLLIGMITGVWKYWEIRQSKNSRAHYYVDIAHRASLLYAPACLILAVLAMFTVLSENISCFLVSGNILFFLSSVISYIFHGLLKDTTNQFRTPHKMAQFILPNYLMTMFMLSLIVVEIGCTFLLVIGTMRYLF